MQNAQGARPRLIDDLMRAAYQLSAADSRLRGRATRHVDALSLTHARALRSLDENGPMTIGELALRVETTGPAVTQLVTGLEAAGFVTRTRGETDRRVSTVSLTKAGRDRHRKRQRHLQHSLVELTEDLDPVHIATAATVLRRLADLYDTL
jgi:MarR family transcriptional regulator, organic hydroperoxide resistance regulator